MPRLRHFARGGQGSVAAPPPQTRARADPEGNQRLARELEFSSRMKTTLLLVIASLTLSLASVTGCRNTAEGVKDDTQNAVHKTGEELKKAGDSMSDAGSAD